MSKKASNAGGTSAAAGQRKKEKPAPERASVFDKVVASAPQDDKAEELWPNLWELIMPKYKDGICTRQPGSLRIKVEGSYFRVYLECPTEGLCTSIMLATMNNAFEAFEGAAARGELNWVPTFDRAKKNKPVIDELMP